MKSALCTLAVAQRRSRQKGVGPFKSVSFSLSAFLLGFKDAALCDSHYLTSFNVFIFPAISVCPFL